MAENQPLDGNKRAALNAALLFLGDQGLADARRRFTLMGIKTDGTVRAHLDWAVARGRLLPWE